MSVRLPDELGEWTPERLDTANRNWNLLQPLEGNRGWTYLQTRLQEEAESLSHQVRMCKEPAEIQRLHNQWLARIELASILADAKRENADANRVRDYLKAQEQEQ